MEDQSQEIKFNIPSVTTSYTHIYLKADSLEQWEKNMPDVPNVTEIEIDIGGEVRTATLRLLWEKLGPHAVHPICKDCGGTGSVEIEPQPFKIEGKTYKLRAYNRCPSCDGTGRIIPKNDTSGLPG